MFSKRIISMLVVLSFISQALVVVDTDSYSSVVVEDSSILEELYGENGARSRTVENATLVKDKDVQVVILKIFCPYMMVTCISRCRLVIIVTDLTVLKKVQFHFPMVIVLILPLLGDTLLFERL